VQQCASTWTRSRFRWLVFDDRPFCPWNGLLEILDDRFVLDRGLLEIKGCASISISACSVKKGLTQLTLDIIVMLGINSIESITTAAAAAHAEMVANLRPFLIKELIHSLLFVDATLAWRRWELHSLARVLEFEDRSFGIPRFYGSLWLHHY
jgi:hypothetical protein